MSIFIPPPQPYNLQWTPAGTLEQANDQLALIVSQAEEMFQSLFTRPTIAIDTSTTSSSSSSSSSGITAVTNDTNVTGAISGTTLTLGWTGTLAVPRGGTGLGACAQGDLFYGSAVNTISALTKSATATRYLSNTGASNSPAWAQVDLSNGVTGNLPVANLNSGGGATSSTFWRGDGSWAAPSGSSGEAFADFSSQRVAWAYAVAGQTTLIENTMGSAWSTVSNAPTASTVDTDANYVYATTTAVSGNVVGLSCGNTASNWQTGGTYIWVVKTGPDVTNVRFWCGFGAVINMGGSDNPSNQDFCGFRFSTTVPDAGWIGYCLTTGVAHANSKTTSLATVAANTVYRLKMVVAASGASFTFSVNGGASQVVNTNLPTAATPLTPFFTCSCNANAIKTLQFSKFYMVTP